MVGGILYLISLSDILLLAYRHVRDFCLMILCPVNLLYALISFSQFLMASLGFSMWRIMPSANNEKFTSFFQSGFLFFHFLH